MRKLLSLLIVLTSFLAALPTAAAPSSRLASGHWVRVEVDTTGIFELSHATLRGLGFEEPAKVGVYGYGAILATGRTENAIPDDICPTAFMHTADGRLLFYGEGDVRATLTSDDNASFIRNNFDTKGVYFLGAAEDSAPEAIPYTPGFSVLDSHNHIKLIEREVQSPGEVGTTFHSTILGPGMSERYTFPIKDFNESYNDAKVMFRYGIAVSSQYVTRVETVLPPDVETLENENLQSISNMIANRLYNVVWGYSTFAPLYTGDFDDTTVDIDIKIASVFRGTYAAVDKAYIIYPRYNRLDGGELFMNFPGWAAGRCFTVSGADPDAVVWNVTNPVDIRPYSLSYDADKGTATGTFAAGGTQSLRLVAFNPSAGHRSPRVCGVVPNQNLRASDTPDYLIVSTSTLLPAAEELAEIHRNLQGLDVVVVSQEQIYNEFSSGMRMPEGIRRLVSMYAARRPGKLRYVLLYGPTEWDMRHIKGSEKDCLPSYACEEELLTRDLPLAYHSDIYYGITSENFSFPLIYSTPQQISVGRLPASGLSTAYAANEKSRRRLLAEPSPETFLHAVKFSDDGDNRAHFDYSEEVVDRLLAANKAMTVSRADNLLYPWHRNFAEEASRKLRKTLRDGAGFLFFTGHGSATGLTAEQIYNVHYIETEVYERAPLAFLSSCITFPYDGRDLTLVQRLVFNDKGGAIGAIGACRPVYLEQNRPLSNAFATAYAGAAPGSTGADVLRMARNSLLSMGSTQALGYNTLCYNYCGDPALPLWIPSLAVEFVGGSSEFRPLEESVLKGKITGNRGELKSDFNGRALVRIYDVPTTMRTLTRNSDDGASVAVSADDNILAEFAAPVENGEFFMRFRLPEVSAEGMRRIVVTAVDSATGALAAGIRRDFNISGDSGSAPYEVPRIIDFALADGMEENAVSPSFSAVARVEPTSFGLASQTALRQGIAVTVDGASAGDGVSVTRNYRSDGTIDLSLSFRALATGPHGIVLRATANNGELAEAAMNIFVTDGILRGTLTAENADPAREAVDFSLDAPADCSATLLVTAADGSTVLRREACAFPFRWNLRSAEGAPVNDGSYRAWVLLEADGRIGSTEKVEITVLKPVQGNKY